MACCVAPASGISTLGCAIDAEAARRLDLKAPGMEFASEMIVRSAQDGLRIAEVPTTLKQDGRPPAIAPAHLALWLAPSALSSDVQPALAPGHCSAMFGQPISIVVLPGPVYVGALHLSPRPH
jgi:hypothetical protein